MTSWKSALAGLLAGAVNGLLGAGGGMVLVPLLAASRDWEETEIFPASVAIMLPVCIVSLTVSGLAQRLPWPDALPYLLGAAAGGILAGLLGRRIPVRWLHRLLGIMILWGGCRYLWQSM